MSFTAASLFAGAGGLDLGFSMAGFDLRWANDNDPDAVNTYRKNLGPHAHLGDVSEVSAEEVPDVDVILGGFPCQGFSLANTGRREDDRRNKLYLEMLRLVTEKRPKIFVAENVRGLAIMAKGAVLHAITEDFRGAGYTVEYKILNAADYGVPQRRQRVFIVGVRNDLALDFSFPRATHGNGGLEGLFPWVSVGEALASIPDPDETHELLNHTYSKYKLRFNGYIGHRAIDPTKPAPTVTGRGDNKGGVVVLHHPSNERRMSVRELATVQSFPLGFEFIATQSSAYRLIGNAVPPRLAYHVAISVQELLAANTRSCEVAL